MYFGNSKDQKMSDAARQRMNEIDQITNQNDRPDNATSTDTPATEAEVENAGMHNRKDGEPLLEFIKRSCVWCSRSQGDDRTVLEFLVRSQGIWLHALQYRIVGPDGKICYKTDLPEWSQI